MTVPWIENEPALCTSERSCGTEIIPGNLFKSTHQPINWKTDGVKEVPRGTVEEKEGGKQWDNKEAKEVDEMGEDVSTVY